MKKASERALTKLVQYKEENEMTEEMKQKELFDKLKKRDDAFRDWLKKMEQDAAEKKKGQKARAQHLMELKAEIRRENVKKVKETQEKFQRAEEYMSHKRDAADRDLAVRQEHRKLREEDKMENVERERRREDYRFQKLKEKELRIAEKLKMQRAQQEMIQKARIEAALHAKIEKERILGGMSTVAENLFFAQSPQFAPKRNATSVRALKPAEITPLRSPVALGSKKQIEKTMMLLDTLIPASQQTENMKTIKQTVAPTDAKRASIGNLNPLESPAPKQPDQKFAYPTPKH